MKLTFALCTMATLATALPAPKDPNIGDPLGLGYSIGRHFDRDVDHADINSRGDTDDLKDGKLGQPVIARDVTAENERRGEPKFGDSLFGEGVRHDRRGEPKFGDSLFGEGVRHDRRGEPKFGDSLFGEGVRHDRRDEPKFGDSLFGEGVRHDRRGDPKFGESEFGIGERPKSN
ncbi:hypothetical protein JDV02_003183 [Purpureocillium takamizusanense]|uniref:Uncharacterized protein n=1 Tax=Purpureocillium takamizusanense TaxID=2060973 RepID=A0A9Q8QB25_9HYPO|nr:uncharacterized protein JDV02_003183 [Purpureocillium takamizusanense]UNI16778.1 hypothetical protein JDV02_003183 [Purpureocillium takamizusanense]